MGQGKLPAKCADCEAIGPKRSEAADHGWWQPNRGRRAAGRTPIWYCPTCAQPHQEEARTRARASRPDPRAATVLRALAVLGR